MRRTLIGCAGLLAGLLAVLSVFPSAAARSPFETDFFALAAPAVSGRALEDDNPNDASAGPSPRLSVDRDSDGSSSGRSDELQALENKVRRCLSQYYQRPVRTAEHSPWGIMHAAIAFGVDSEVYSAERRVNAIGYLCWNGSCRGQRLFTLQGNRLYPQEGPGVQGHPGQFLAILAQSRVRSDYPIKVQGRSFTVADLIEYEKRTCRSGTELTFKLIGLSHYLDSDASWRNDQNESWDIPRLIREELSQPVIGATCGGTHRLMGFAWALKRRQKQGQPVDGQWLRAQKYLEDYHEYTFRLQNPDGSFSSNYFEGRGDWGSAERRLETTGHILEWLSYSVPDEQLDDPRLVRAVDYLVTLLTQGNTSWQIGPLGHALHALAIYDERMFGAVPGERGTTLVRDLQKSDGQ